MLKVKKGADWIPLGVDRIKQGRDVFAWANFNGLNGDLNASSGITSVDKIGTGWYNVNFENPQSDKNFGTHVTPGNKAGTNSICGIARYGNSDENYIQVRLSYHENKDVNIDPVYVCCFRF